MKYKVGDRVKIKSNDFFNKNKGKLSFYVDSMALCFSNEIVTIKSHGRYPNTYRILEDEGDFLWTDEMIEGLAEEEPKSEPKFHIQDAKDGDVLAEDSCIFIIQKLGDNGTAAKTHCTLYDDGVFENGSILYFDIDSTKPATEEKKQKLFNAIKDNGYKWNPETKTLEKPIEPKFREYSDNKPLDVPKMTTEFIKEIGGLPCPEGYVFKDENGNVINTTKIVLEKKKKEYPKTYKECCEILGFDEFLYSNTPVNFWYKWKLFHTLNMLIICRDAYWKLAGDEMGLGKPWEPDFDNLSTNLEYIKIVKGCFVHSSRAFAFPTAEMRDAFKENFDPDIEICKELL